MKPDFLRRRFLYQSLTSFGGVILMGGCAAQKTGLAPRVEAEGPRTALAAPGADGFSPLGPPDQNQLRLPEGFSSRIVATTGEPVGRTEHTWHAEPDGGATFATPSGGWVYVSNAEVVRGGGGVGAIEFDAAGEIVDAYSILSGTTRNCAGGPTPWQTWLSCEETRQGRVWECDPFTKGSEGIPRPAMGVFNHEAAAVDAAHQQVFLTEDERDGRLYRFRPANYPKLDRGVLEVAEILDPAGRGSIQRGESRRLRWHPVPDPETRRGVPTREQVRSSTPFNGGEGAWQNAGRIYFATKGDHRVWELDPESDQIRILYEHATAAPGKAALRGVDNVFASQTGDILVAEDGGNFEIVALTPSGQVKPIVQIVNQTNSSEVTGPALSPDGTRLYFSSQSGPGKTYEVRGPFV
ncbi:MAG: alkaline phosphatase PhoX [Myxococcota bacterium]